MPKRAVIGRVLMSALLAATVASPAAAQPDDPFALLAPLSRPPCAPAATTALGVSDVVEQALCNNPQTREVWANARFQAAQVGVAEAAYLPTINAAVGAGRDRTTQSGADSPTNRASASVALSYLLYDFGARAATLENARQLFEAAAASRDNTVQAVFYSAVQAYYQVQAAQAALVAASETERGARESFRAAEARYGVGSATPADKLQAQTAYSQASLTRIQADGGLRVAHGNLAAVIGRDANSPVTLVPHAPPVPTAATEQDVAALIVVARERRPDLLAAEARLRAAKANANAVEAGGKPTLSLGVSGATSHGDSTVNSSSVGVSLNIPIFSGYATTYKVRAAQAQIEASAAQRDRVRLQVALDVWTASQNLLTAGQSLRSSADLLTSAEQSERVAAGRYKEGVGSILDLLTAQSALANARQQRVQAEFNWNLARTTLALAVGNLDLNLLRDISGAAAPTTNVDKYKP